MFLGCTIVLSLSMTLHCVTCVCRIVIKVMDGWMDGYSLKFCFKMMMMMTTTTTMMMMIIIIITRSSLGRAHLPPTTVFRCLKTTTSAQYQWDFPDVIKFRIAVHTQWEKRIRFRHPDYDPDRAQKLTSSSMSRHLSTRKMSSKSMHAFLSNLANRQTDRQTDIAGNRIYLLCCRM